MSTNIGILLDVSGSMKSSIGDGVNEEGGIWARSIYTVLNDLVEHDISRDNYVFAAGVGASKGDEIFDIIGTTKSLQKLNEMITDSRPASDNTIDDIFCLLEKNGARNIRKWARKCVVSLTVSENKAMLILKEMKTDNNFAKQIAMSLPESCRDWNNVVPFSGVFHSLFSSAVSTIRQATVEEVTDVAKKAMDSIKQSQIKAYTDQSMYSVRDAATIIHAIDHKRDLTTPRAREFLTAIEPYIYGGTPLYSALEKASCSLSKSKRFYPNHRQLLFVLSDGMATDKGDLTHILSVLKDANVTIVGCYISRSSDVEPRTLHDVEGTNWEDGAKFLFNLSSIIPTNMVTREIFRKHGWRIDITNNETKLFMHVNHPDHLNDACALARNVVCSQDALTDLLSSVSLDVYISQRNTKIRAHEQIGGTCYANASAAVLYLAMHRILGRDDGYPDFEEIRDDLIKNHGSEGANTFRVLKEVCPVYRLHCKEVNVIGAMEAITAKRPVVAKFRLTASEWETFGTFYRNNPTGILKKENLDISMLSRYAGTTGHAVVLTSYNSECLRLMNSWGEDWADMGFFRIENADVLGLEFIDVFWTKNDLSQSETDYYRIHGSRIADVLVSSLKSLQVAEFTCPLCMSTSKVTEFSGTLSHARCLRCNETFNCTEGEGNILALNMYLTSLSR